jgi:hypothetical protein
MIFRNLWVLCVVQYFLVCKQRKENIFIVEKSSFRRRDKWESVDRDTNFLNFIYFSKKKPNNKSSSITTLEIVWKNKIYVFMFC